MLSVPEGVNRFPDQLDQWGLGPRSGPKHPERAKAQHLQGCALVSWPAAPGSGGEKSFAYRVLEATDVDPCEFSGPRLISVDNGTEQVHMLMDVPGQVGQAIQDHAPDSCCEIVIADQDIFEVGIGGGRIDASVDAGVQPQCFDDRRCARVE